MRKKRKNKSFRSMESLKRDLARKVDKRVKELLKDQKFLATVDKEIDALESNSDIDSYMVKDIQRLSEVEAEERRVTNWVKLGEDQIAS